MTTHFIVPHRSVSRSVPSLFHPTFHQGWNFGSFDRLFSDLLPMAKSSQSRRPLFVPEVDVVETDQDLRFSVELPGFEQVDFEVLVDSDVLIIKGEKKARSSDDDQLHRVECSSGPFERRFRPGWEIDADNLKASYKNGVLEVTLPKPADEPDTVRTIPITAS